MTTLATLTPAPSEITHPMIGLESCQKSLLAGMGDEAADAHDDPGMVGHLIQRVEDAVKQARAGDDGSGTTPA